MNIQFGRDICNNLELAEKREWLVTNGIGGFASLTIAGLLTRRYHGLLIAALQPPLGRTLLLSKLDETVDYNDNYYPIHTNRWAGDIMGEEGYFQIESFCLEGTIPVWRFACADALLEKRIWMQPGENTTYIHYSLIRASQPLKLSIKALVNYRDYHSTTTSYNWQMGIETLKNGICVTAYPSAVPFYVLSDRGEVSASHIWYYGFDLAVERERGLSDREDHLHAATFNTILAPGESITIVASTENNPIIDAQTALEARHTYEKTLLSQDDRTPDWIQQLRLSGDQFIVSRSLPDEPNGKTIIAGYPWFGDWGRDTMIGLPGLTLATGRTEIARPILHTFAHYIDRGMLPNLFPDGGETPEYNTIDATLWYFEAIRAYHAKTGDDDLLNELFPALADIITWHRQGTRYNIHLDPSDGLIYGGEEGVQLTWMDAKVGDLVVTPRMGKPVEINALWYNALVIMQQFARQLGKSAQEYEQLARQTARGFSRFWNPNKGYCYDVIDSPVGNDKSLRPNQIFAVSLPTESDFPPLLTPEQRQAIVDTCARTLLTSYGLRSLSPDDASYYEQYKGDRDQRDRAYHQGTVWGWLIGAFVQAHLKVYNNPGLARTFLEPMATHLQDGCVGNLSEIFDAEIPFTPKGAFAQAWTVAEVLRVWERL